MSILPSIISSATIRESVELGRRAVAALETCAAALTEQAALMGEPEEVVTHNGKLETEQKPNDFTKEIVEQLVNSSVIGAAHNFAQELEDIMDAGWSMPVKQGKLRDLIKKYQEEPKKKK